VLPELQGAGLGRYFFEWVKTKAIDNKQKKIFLNVNKNNKARFFYEKLGFSQVKEEVIAIGQGYVMDDYVMEITI
jgi:ribosomal protein S18 acetylase RimI-like enzyme